jgi:hypothetical protein
MKDWDGRELEVTTLYHKEHANPELGKQGPNDPFYWNFLEMEFDPRPVDAKIGLRVRNLVDPPDAEPRGGAPLETANSTTGRPSSCSLPVIKTLPNADVRFVFAETGAPIRGARSRADGTVAVSGLADVLPGTKLIVTAYDGEKSESQTIVAGAV